MKTKTGRMLALIAVYILAAPLTLLWCIGYLTYAIIQNKRMFGEFDIIDSTKAFVLGMKQGHRINMYWVNHGVHMGELDYLMEVFGESE